MLSSASMYCQSCGTENPEDARFCKYCGISIAQPGGKGGLIVEGEEIQKGADLGSGSDTIKDDPPARAAPDEPRPPVRVENTLAGLKATSNSSLTNMSLSFTAMSVRTPARSYLVALGIVGGLVLLGAGTMYGVMLVYAQNTAVIATNPERASSELPPVEIGFPSREIDDEDLANLASGQVSRPRRRPSSSSGSGGSSTTPSGGDDPVDDPSRSSSTTVEPSGGSSPSSGTGGSSSGETGSSSGGSGSQGSGETEAGGTSGSSGTGGSTMPPGFDEGLEERDPEMDMYAGHVRRVIRRYYAARAQSCFDRSTRNNHGLRGTVVIQFTIGPGGNVTAARPARNTTGDDDLAACLAGQIRSWRLPAPPEDEPVTMQMPFSW